MPYLPIRFQDTFTHRVFIQTPPPLSNLNPRSKSTHRPKTLARFGPTSGSKTWTAIKANANVAENTDTHSRTTHPLLDNTNIRRCRRESTRRRTQPRSSFAGFLQPLGVSYIRQNLSLTYDAHTSTHVGHLRVSTTLGVSAANSKKHSN